MTDQLQHDKIVAKIQHYADLLRQYQNDKENLLLTTATERDCEREKLKHQILLCQELLKDYYQIFDDILYR